MTKNCNANLRRARMERKAERRRGWFDAVLSSIRDGVIVTGARSEIVFLNRAAEDLPALAASFALGLGSIFRCSLHGESVLVAA